MNDTPYVKSAMLGPEVIATMTAVSSAVSSAEPIGEIKAWPSEIALLGELDGTNNLRRLDHL